MAKLDSYDFRGLPQEVTDFKDQITDIVNFGKVQAQVTATVPNWRGRRGEHVWYINGTDGRLYMASSDQSTTWTQVLSFTV